MTRFFRWASTLLLALSITNAPAIAQTSSSLNGEEVVRVIQRGATKSTNIAGLLASRGASPQVEKLVRQQQRALNNNAYDQPDYGSGATAGKTVPTLTWSATAGTGKTQARLMNDADNSWGAFYGGIPTQISGASWGFPVVASTIGNPIVGSGRGAVGWAVEIITDDAAPALMMNYNPVAQVRVLVDGQFVSRTPAVMSNANSGGFQYLIVDFGAKSAKGRHIRFEGELNLPYRGVYVSPSSRVWKPTPADFVRAAWFGDSKAAYATQSNTPNSYAHDNLASITMRLLGVTDANQLGAAGTGVASDNVAIGFRYSSRMNDLALLQALPGGVDVVFFQGSINDRDKSPALIQSEMAADIVAARAIVGPTVPIFVLGVDGGGLGSGYTVSAGVLAAEQALQAAVTASGDQLVSFVPISTIAPTPVMFGDATTGTASAYMQTDMIHETFGASVPGIGGMEYLSRATAAGVRSATTRLRR